MSKPQTETIDLSAFNQTPELEARQAAFMEKIKSWLLVIMLWVVFWFVAGLIYRPLFMVLPLSLCIGSMYYSSSVSHRTPRSNYYLELFAPRNGLEYEPSPDYFSNGIIFKIGNNDHRTIDQLRGKMYRYDYCLYWHAYSAGSGKRKRHYYYEVLEVLLPKKLPHIFIDYKGNNTFGQDILDRFKNENMIRLEGEFPDHFKVYAVQQYAPAVLTILNPAFMAALIDQKINYEIELVDNRAYIYIANEMAATKENIMKIYEAAEFLILELQKQLDTFTFELDGNTSDKIKTSTIKRLTQI